MTRPGGRTTRLWALAVVLAFAGAGAALLPRPPAAPVVDDPLAAADPGALRQLVAGVSFHGEDADTAWTATTGGCVEVATGDRVVRDLVLPQGARITALHGHLHDDGTGPPTSLRLERHAVPAAGGAAPPVTEVVFEVSSAAGDDSGHQTLVDATPTPDADAAVVDHDGWALTLAATGGGSSPDLCGVTVEYALDLDTTALVFQPTAPCAAFDSRPGRGGRAAPVAGGATVTIDLVADDHAAQGGTAGRCVPPAVGPDRPDGTVAVLVNLVAVEPAGTGNLRLWDADDPEPDGGVLVYAPGADNNNAVPIGIANATSGDDGGEVVVRNNGGRPVHVRVVVLGWYEPLPVPPA